jgi:eukaryotic-like serine/threonine-protein kinase
MRSIKTLLSIGLVILSCGISLAQQKPRRIVTKARPRWVALVVGVSGYKSFQDADHAGVRGLNFAHLDAERVAAKLKQMGWQVCLLESQPRAASSRATKANILAQLRKISTSPSDTLMFFFSGHGAQRNGNLYVVPYDMEYVRQTGANGTAEYVENTRKMISYDELGDCLQHVPASRRLLVMDACQNLPEGKALTAEGESPQVKLGQIVIRSEQTVRSWGVLTSCSAGETSWEDPTLYNGQGGGVFTYAFLRALDSPRSAGYKGLVTPEPLNRELSRTVAAWCATRDPQHHMTPGYSSYIPGNEPIILGRNRSTSYRR